MKVKICILGDANETGRNVCYEDYTCRYFISNEETIKECIDRAKMKCVGDFVHLPTLYRELGLADTVFLRVYCDEIEIEKD